ncbi:MAG: DEAD/DEAH box helicase, partial [Candidatus Dadabacteria bacterium]
KLNTENKFLIYGDNALDLLTKRDEELFEIFTVQNIEALRKKIKLRNLKLLVELKRVDFTSSLKEEERFKCSINLLLNGAKVPLSILFKHSESYERWVKIEENTFAPAPSGSLRSLKALLASLDPNYEFKNSITAEVSSAQAVSLLLYDQEKIVVNNDDEKLQSIKKKLSTFRKIRKVPVPKGFKGRLRSYQREGLNWLVFLNEFGFSGILADEMGLGKTVQTLALLQFLKERGEAEGRKRRPSLVIAPTSVLRNWYSEAKRFVPNLKVLVFAGKDREEMFEALHNYDLVITSYALLRRDKVLLSSISWEYVILDEAQHIKNYQTTTARVVKALTARYRLALSGTPTENRPLELWSLFDFLMPGYLGSRLVFQQTVEKPLLEDGENSAVTNLIVKKIYPFILRRTKKEVESSLPPKVESEICVPMEDEQREIYRKILHDSRIKVFNQVAKYGIKRASLHILAALTKLRQVCNHPLSLEDWQSWAEEGVKDRSIKSGKFEAFKEVINEALSADRKIVVFCQFLKMMEIMKGWFREEGINFLYLDGSTQNRQELISQFNQDRECPIFLISLKAGGLGINLTSADTVILYDPWWNPAVEDQAIDRTHRIGQKNKVIIYKLLTENSVEERINSLKSKKKQLSEAFLSTSSPTLNLTKRDLERLFSFY